jgi:hypothetical protein
MAKLSDLDFGHLGLGRFFGPGPLHPPFHRVAFMCDLEAHGDPAEVAVWELRDVGPLMTGQGPFPVRSGVLTLMGGWQLTSGSKSSRVVYEGKLIGGHKLSLEDAAALDRGEVGGLHIRFVFRCDDCGDAVRCQDIKVQRALDGLRDAGWTSVTLTGLRGIL